MSQWPPGHPWGNRLQQRFWIYHPTALMAAGQRENGATVRMAPGIPVEFVTSDPRFVAEALRSSESVRPAAANDVLADVVGSGSVLTTNGARHRALRRQTRAAIARISLDDRTRMAIDAAVARLPASVLRMLPWLHRLTLDTLLRSLFGDLPQQLGRTLADILLADVRLNRSPALFAGDSFRPWRLLAAQERRLTSSLAEAIEYAGDSYRGPSLDQLPTLLITGHETTAVAAAWCVERLAREHTIAAVLPARIMDGDRPYILAVIHETMRLRPVIPLLIRSTPVSLARRAGSVRRDSITGLAGWQVHRDPRFFSDPEMIHPERFTNARTPVQSWLPFGGGDRRCLGEHWATEVVAAIVSALFSRFEVSPVHLAGELPVRRSIMIAPAGGVLVDLRLRRP